MHQEVDGYWEKEEFEDLVARSLSTFFETKIKKQKNSHKVFRFTPEITSPNKM